MDEATFNQLRNVFRYIDATQQEPAKRAIFGNLGHECFLKHKAWAESIGTDIQRVIDDVNVKNLSPYWERLEFSADGSVLYLT
jgi:hypothetical protein